MLELFIAKLFGLYLIIMGVLVLARKRSLMPGIMEIAKSRALTLVLGALEIVAGLAIVLTWSEVSMSPLGIIALIGYMMVIEGVVYLALPLKSIQKLVRSFGNKQWFMASGIVAVLAGVYLAGFGFGYF
jgi:uncharacterized membrane protein HdeD (DUF308 family)